jgi:hypothetical protein
MNLNHWECYLCKKVHTTSPIIVHSKPMNEICLRELIDLAEYWGKHYKDPNSMDYLRASWLWPMNGGGGNSRWSLTGTDSSRECFFCKKQNTGHGMASFIEGGHADNIHSGCLRTFLPPPISPAEFMQQIQELLA